MGGGRDKCSSSLGYVGILRIGQHVNINPLRERCKRTGTRDSVEKRGIWDPYLPTLSVIPEVCDQPFAGSSREIPLHASEASLVITAFIALGTSCCLNLFPFAFLFLTSLFLSVILLSSTVWTLLPLLDSSLHESTFTEYSPHFNSAVSDSYALGF